MPAVAWTWGRGGYLKSYLILPLVSPKLITFNNGMIEGLSQLTTNFNKFAMFAHVMMHYMVQQVR